MRKTDTMDQTAEEQQIANQAMKELKGNDQAKKKEPWELAYEADHGEQQPEESKAQPAEEQPAEEEAEPVKEEKQEQPKAEEEKPIESVERPKKEVQVQEQPIDDEDAEKTKAIIQKYKTAEEMAKALRSTQSAYDKLKSEQATKEQETVEPVPSVNPAIEVKYWIEQNRDKVVEQYRQQYPARSRDMEDDAILEVVYERTYNDYVNWQTRQKDEIKNRASIARSKMLDSIPQEDRAYLSEVKAVLDKTADHLILGNKFDINDIVYWAKGKNVSRLVKEAEERAYKRAKEESRIVAEVPSSNASAKVSTKKTVSSTQLSNYDKERALEMYEGTTMTDDEKFQEYSELKKKKK